MFVQYTLLEFSQALLFFTDIRELLRFKIISCVLHYMRETYTSKMIEMFYAPDWSFPAPENAENRQFQVSKCI